MPQRIARYLRRNAIAVLALFVALGGSSYAAITISGGQLRNHSVDAVKLNPRSISGSIKAWVNVRQTSRGLAAVGSSSPVRVDARGQLVSIRWLRQRFAAACGASVTPEFGADGASGGYVTTLFYTGKSPELGVFGHAADGTPRAQPAFVLIVCP